MIDPNARPHDKFQEAAAEVHETPAEVHETPAEVHETPAEVHETPAEVRYSETDQMGFAHHSNAITWFEMGRINWLKDQGLAYGELEKQGILMPVIKLQLRYHQPARFEDQLIIQTRLVALRWVAVTFENRIFRGSASTNQRTLIAEGQVELACIGRDGKIRRFSKELYTRFDQCLNQQANDQARTR